MHEVPGSNPGIFCWKRSSDVQHHFLRPWEVHTSITQRKLTSGHTKGWILHMAASCVPKSCCRQRCAGVALGTPPRNAHRFSTAVKSWLLHGYSCMRLYILCYHFFPQECHEHTVNNFPFGKFAFFFNEHFSFWASNSTQVCFTGAFANGSEQLKKIFFPRNQPKSGLAK